jgi:hypothetical protein
MVGRYKQIKKGGPHMDKENNEYKSLKSLREATEEKLVLSSTGYGFVNTTTNSSNENLDEKTE